MRQVRIRDVNTKRWRTKWFLLCAAGMLLGGCGSPEASLEPAEPQTEAASPAEPKPTLPAIDPPYSFDFDRMTASDFGAYFQEDYGGSAEEYLLLSGTEWENHVVHIAGEEEGPCVYVIAGVHGDEEAAWQAGKLLQRVSLRAGDLYVLAPANRWGAEKEPKSRYVISGEDLNRSFPGDPEGNAAERIADSIYKDVERTAPELVLDLHEARPVREGYDSLGSTLIFTDMRDSMELLMTLVSETETGELCSEPYSLYGPGPSGSVNAEISRGLDIPVITVETSRVYPIKRRISDQLAVVWRVLEWFDMAGEGENEDGI